MVMLIPKPGKATAHLNCWDAHLRMCVFVRGCMCVCVLQMVIAEGSVVQIEALSESINNLTVRSSTRGLQLMTHAANSLRR